MAKIVTGNFEVKYRCAVCKAEDSNKYWAHEQAFPVINCWSCHAGFRKDIPEMIQTRQGMFPVQQ